MQVRRFLSILQTDGYTSLDAALLISDAQYTRYNPISLRQTLSIDYTTRGVTSWKKGEYSETLVDFARAVEIDSKNIQIYHNRCLIWIKKGELDSATADCTKAIEIDPRFAKAHVSRGVAWGMKGDLDKEIADYTRALVIDSRNTMALVNRGFAYGLKCEWGKAIADYKSAIGIDPRDVNAYFNSGVTKIIIMNFREAARDLSEYLQRTGMSFDSCVRGATKGVAPHWEKKDVKPMADQFQTDTSVSIAEAEIRLILCYAFWLNGERDVAVDKFDDLKIEMAFTRKPSASTEKFLKDLFAAMPADMQRDKRVKDAIHYIYDINRADHG